ncbi:type IV pilus assembly protein PilM, partial [bacterium]|nr:type IV pilus assembly protein PilM [bacterium]
GIRTKNVATAISGDSVIVRYVKLPYMSEDELKNVITYEAEQYIPLAIDLVVLDFEILGELEEEGQRKIEVLLVAAKEDIIDQHVDILKRAGLTPIVIDVDTFALENAFDYNFGQAEAETETISLVHIGAKLTTINILENGVSHLTRDVAVAGNNFTREIQREFGISFIQAEELKFRAGEVPIESEDIMQMEMPGKDNESNRIGEAITPVLNKLVAEIQRSFDYYESSIRRGTISRIQLSGGTSRLKKIEKYLADKLNLVVGMNDPFQNISIPEKEFDIGFITARAQMFNVVVGLAMRQVE